MLPELNLFYCEPFDDRWLLLDRYPRRFARWLLCGNPISGHMQLVRQLRVGLERAGIRCRFNSYRRSARKPGEPIGVLGKNKVLDNWLPKNPTVFGPCMLDHPKDRIDLFDRFNAKYYLVPSVWVHDMFAPYFGDRVLIWPIGIDLGLWADFSRETKTVDFLVYEKFLWNRPHKVQTILGPILSELQRRGLSTLVLHCGSYTHEQYRECLRRSKYMIFLCEHETQGQAYQQALACNVPIMAWDLGSWLDPKAQRYERKPIRASSVPYFSPDCGLTFRRIEEFSEQLNEFLATSFSPRQFVQAHLNLVDSARRYAEIVRAAGA